jgi:hypothetical protein
MAHDQEEPDERGAPLLALPPGHSGCPAGPSRSGPPAPRLCPPGGLNSAPGLPHPHDRCHQRLAPLRPRHRCARSASLRSPWRASPWPTGGERTARRSVRSSRRTGVPMGVTAGRSCPGAFEGAPPQEGLRSESRGPRTTPPLRSRGRESRGAPLRGCRGVSGRGTPRFRFCATTTSASNRLDWRPPEGAPEGQHRRGCPVTEAGDGALGPTG